MRNVAVDEAAAEALAAWQAGAVGIVVGHVRRPRPQP